MIQLVTITANIVTNAPNTGTIRAQVPPLVILTSNNTRELGDALKRRCLHLHIGFPSPALELQVLRARVPALNAQLLAQLVAFVQALRYLTNRISLFLTLPLALLVLTYLVVKIMGVAVNDRSEAATTMVVPGFLVGLYEVDRFAVLFPNLDASLQPEFGALMFACYAAVIIAGVVSSRLESI